MTEEKNITSLGDEELKMPEGHPGPPPPSKGEVWASHRQDHLLDLRDELNGRYALVLNPTDAETRLFNELTRALDDIIVPPSLDGPGTIIIDDRLDAVAKTLTSLKWPQVDSRANDLRHIKVEPLEVAPDFLKRVRERRGPTEEEIAEANKKNRSAFLEFFDLAGKLNETAHAFGIKSAALNADTGEVTVVFRTREPSAPTP
jgi:hypothetical protein